MLLCAADTVSFISIVIVIVATFQSLVRHFFGCFVLTLSRLQIPYFLLYCILFMSVIQLFLCTSSINFSVFVFLLCI